MAVHLGLNKTDTEGRILARAILKAKVKHPFRSKMQVH